MYFRIITLFPEFFVGPLSSALMQRARDAGIVRFSYHNPRDAATDRHRSVDDRPYGGGPGMVMLPGPVADTLRSLRFDARGQKQPGRLICLSPKGMPLSQELARELALGAASRPSADTGGHDAPNITLVCGRYEGLDARIEAHFPVENVSVGDFILNGGETAALCLIEAVSRLLPGFMGHKESGTDESFSQGLLEYPHYTRPDNFEGLPVPEVLRSGDHAGIALWRRRASLALTLERRPELLEDAPLTCEDRDFLRKLPASRIGRNLYCALVHYPVLDKDKNSLAVSLTNFDIHDIARSSYTYGLGGYYVLTPLEDQRELLAAIMRHWTQGAGKRSNPDRSAALSVVREGAVVEDAVADVRRRTGQEPMLVGTAAGIRKTSPPGIISFARIAAILQKQPVLLLFGTGHGLAPEIARLCHAFAPPLRWHGGYNHLSVRSAAAIIFDRILGDWR
ncbi:MAG: tRNA (guanosine(37)-N1)-methyltransferase TrmD [Desulfovibrio sp.]|nr:tRNA (guanosine(37)-N1)-methyltransferase TrmD [Desulfovibrio sp.]